MVASRWITAAQLITEQPCKLIGLLVTPSAADAQCILYDGESTVAPVLLSVYLVTRNTQNFNFPEGVIATRGLFVGSFTNITGVLVRWEV